MPTPATAAGQILDACLRGRPWSAARLRELVQSGDRALFSVLVEGLCDRFDPVLCQTYARLFSEVISSVFPQWTADELISRYQRVRVARRFEGSAERVFVLSRVTLGADVAVTSLVLDAAKRRFPKAEIVLVGGDKSAELFAADPRIRHLPVGYRRTGTLAERFSVLPELRETLSGAGAIVIDPDSRLTQLGLLPVCPEESYYFFESRAYGEDGEESLVALTRRWLKETFGIADARAYVAPRQEAGGATPAPVITVSLGVGENPAKRIRDPFESELLGLLDGTGATVLVDSGAGGEEAERVNRAVARTGNAKILRGSFAAFAGAISRSQLYVGYDSAGQHVAAACGVPLLTVFAGFPAPRMFSRWRPDGPGPIEILRVDDPNPAVVLDATREALHRLWRP